MKQIRIATRKSPLALWQAEFVKAEIEKLNEQIEVILLPIETKGDIILDTPLAKIGGKGLFVKELEVALLNKEADIAVHSMKDVPAAFPEGLTLAGICERANPYDAFVSNQYKSLDELPQGSTIGTSSLRRQAQIRAKRGDLNIVDLRGNVGTRLSKLDNNQYDAIILACAGLERLGLSNRIKSSILPEICLPAVGQGAVGIETRINDVDTINMIKKISHQNTEICIAAERAFNNKLQGGCQVPIAAYATITGEMIKIIGLVASLDGKIVLKDELVGAIADNVILGEQLAQKLINRGADKILAEIGI